MRRKLFFTQFLFIQTPLFAQNEIGPEGHKLVWLLILLIPLFLYLSFKIFRKEKSSQKKIFLKHTKTEISLVKDRLYYPDYLTLTIKNSGNTDVDIDQPLLIFDNFWMKRKFRLKGVNNSQIYPLYLEVGKIHQLQIDLNGFYRHDKKLKKYAKAKVIVETVDGKRLGSKAVFLRKTLFKY